MKHSLGDLLVRHRKHLTLALVSAPMALAASCRPGRSQVNPDINLDGLDLDQALDRYTTTRRRKNPKTGQCRCTLFPAALL